MEYHHHQASSATAFSNKVANGGVLAGKHAYDGIFGCVPKPGSRMEDYREIFGGAGACSIPILDFPELKDRKASMDARSSRPDYSKIFGGFAETDFAVPYEELFSKPKKVKNSSQEARATDKAKFCSAGPEHFNSSEQKHAPLPEVSSQTLDGGKQINLSYNKSNPESKSGTHGMTNVGQLHATPGSTCLIDEITPSQMTEGDKVVYSVSNDANLNVHVSEGIKQSKPFRKIVSGPINLSCNKANPETKSGGITNIGQLQDIPGYTCSIDEITPLQMTEGDKRVHTVSNDAPLNVNVSEGVKQSKQLRKVVSVPINLSYNKNNVESKSCTNGMTNTGQLHAVPGYTSTDEITPLQMTEGGKPVHTVANDGHLNVNVSEGIKQSKPLRKVVSGPQPRESAKNSSRDHANFQKKSSRNKSFSNDISFDAFENGFGMQQSTLSPLSSMPNLGNNRDGTMRSMNSKFRFFSDAASEGAAGSYSPPSLDDEIDTNSAAAASAAAVRKAIEEAQAKIKIAKELMERKKEGLPNRSRSKFSNRLKDERREVDAAEKANRSKEKPKEMLWKPCTPQQDFSSLPEHIATQASHVTPEFRNAKKSSLMENAMGDTNTTGYKLAEVDNRMESESIKAKDEFSEPVDTSAHRAMTMEVEQEKNAERMKLSASENKCKEKMTREENIKKQLECDNEKLKSFEKLEKVKRELNSVEVGFEWDVYRNNIKPAEELHLQIENEKKNRVAYEREEAGLTSKVPSEQEECESTEKWLHESEENKELEIQDLEENKDKEELKESQNLVKIEKKQREAHNQEEMENRFNAVPVGRESKSRLEETCSYKGNENGQKEDLEGLGSEMKQQEGPYQQENEKKLGDANSDDSEKFFQVHEQEVIKVRYNPDMEGSEGMLGEDCVTKGNKKLEETKQNEKTHGEDCGTKGNEQLEETKQNEKTHAGDCGTKGNEKLEETKQNEKMLGEDCGTKGNDNWEETKQNEKMLKEDNQMDETEEVMTCEVLETERKQQQIHLRAEDESNLEATQQALRYQENNLETNNDVYKVDENGNAGKADDAGGYGDKERLEHVKLTAEIFAFEENGKMMDASEDSFPEETGKGSEATEEANDLVEEENFETGVPERDLPGFDGIKKQTTDVCLGETVVTLDHKLNEFHVAEYEKIHEGEKLTEEETSHLDENEKDDSESEFGPSYEENESNSASSQEERWLVNGIESKTLSDSVMHVEEAACELGENNKDMEESEVPSNHEEVETYFESSSEERWINNRIDKQAIQQPHILEGEGINMGISQEDRTNKSTDKKEVKYLENLMVKKKVEGLQKEVESEKKHHGRKEEEKAREMEKERIAVERAIREARERAFAEARERAAAERAAAGAHQRVMADARERLEKAGAEANGKSAAEKASMEAKLKAERAAVERATAEARERALEKALSEKASFKARNQAETFSGASRDGIKSSDQQYKDPCPSNSSKYPSTSNHDGRFNGGNGELAERCKATLERNQRTAERAAKALAEKNMRDLLAQKEQAERNRLAETLDADVKRWSSGKERNLRALLSTLQYILGPDSGWQPIPLTDLISTAAVKKAYRKATLFVHPDKLQQRGASIQQKYTCEKVFDLLKDAWNKFNAEER
ncbi:auxilin-like protein 1 [Manihot esculenta]|uniref:Uncharacterized protein n=1 Tax=Manihot esculenta TaxID=3983 RepID=A0ACB7FWY0_MANES|nr:auxilin-like protein 1 [Manihot esculenta]KAG8632437.1 hypothetical protein MANES_18G022400v8 [Manihot esculenta]